MWLSGKLSAKDFCGYVVAQLVGAAVGAGFLYWFVDMSPMFEFGGVTGDNNRQLLGETGTQFRSGALLAVCMA